MNPISKGTLNVLTNYDNGAIVTFPFKGTNHCLFIPSDKYNKAIHGNIVSVKLIDSKETSIDPIRSLVKDSYDDEVIIDGIGEIIDIVDHNATSVSLSGILNIKSNVIYGVGKNNNRFYLFKPCNLKYPTFMVLTKIKPDQYRNNIYITIKFMKWEITDKYPRGSCEDIIGEIGDFDSEISNCLHVNGLVFKQPKKSIIQKEISETMSIQTMHEKLEHRLDLRNKNVFSIDPIGCKDVDDALHIENLADGFIVGIHIADVSSIVRYNSIIDLEARKKMTSLYLPNGTQHMLPSDLSENYCSLLQDKDRNSLSLLIKVDASGNIYHHEFVQTIINNKLKLTYEEAEKLINKSKHKDLVKLSKVADLLRSKYEYLATDGHEHAEHPISHMLIETFMILTNVFCAESLISKYGDCVLRIHPELNYKFLKNNSDHLSKIHKETNNEDFQIVDKYLKRKSQFSAQYHPYSQLKPDQIKHFGLGVKYYTHFTSPIRRYIDLVNHRLIKGETDHLDLKELQMLCDASNTINIKTKKMYRDLSYLKIIKTLEDSKQSEIKTTGYIVDFVNKTSTAPLKIKVYLPSYEITATITVCHSKISHLYYIERSPTCISLYEESTDKQVTYDLFSKIKVILVPVLNSNIFYNKLRIKLDDNSCDDFYDEI